MPKNQNGGYLGHAPIGPKINISETQQVIYELIQNFMLIIIHKKTIP